MNHPPKLVRLSVIALGVVALLSCALAVAIHTPGPVKGWYQRTFHAPAVLNAGFIVPFDKQQGHSLREQFIAIYRARQGSYGLRRTAFSVEGTPIGECLLVESGRLTLITDYTGDSYSSREFRIQHPTSIELGRLAGGESWGFVTTNDTVYLKSYAESKLIHCF